MLISFVQNDWYWNSQVYLQNLQLVQVICIELHIKLSVSLYYSSGAGCSKLTTSLINVSLNFQKLFSQICQYFLLKKCEKLLQSLIFSTKISV